MHICDLTIAVYVSVLQKKKKLETKNKFIWVCVKSPEVKSVKKRKLSG